MSGSNASGAFGAISFSNFPAATIRLPGVFAEVDNTQANTGQFNPRGLVVAQMLAAGTATPGVPVLTAGSTDSQAKFVQGSHIEHMIRRYRAIDVFGELWALPLLDDPSAVAAVVAVVLGGTATVAAVLSMYVAGQLVAVPVNAGDPAATVVLTAVGVAATLPNLPVVFSVGTLPTTINLTARNKGALGNDIDVRFNYLGSAGGQSLPPGLTVVGVTTSVPGAQNPQSLAPALAALTTQAFDFIIMPFTDTASLNAMQGFLNDQTGRWSWSQELFGGCFSAYRGTFGQRATFGAGRNDQHTSIMGFFDSPSPVWSWAADYGAASAVALRADPGLPLQTLALNVLAPPVASRDLMTTRNTLLYDGISTFTVDAANTVRIENAITTYQVNPAGAPDDSYLEVERLYSLAFLIRDMRTYLQSQFPRKKLVVDGTRIAPGSNMVTSQTVLASAVARYRFQCVQGNAQDGDGFAAAALAQNAGRGQVKLMLPFRLVQQLRIISMLISFTAP